jgi:hypothetical protein
MASTIKPIKYWANNLKKTLGNRDLPSTRIGRINIVKMATLPKAIYKYNAMQFPAKSQHHSSQK